MAQVGFIGLGTMGAGMARRLVDAGHDVVVWNRSRAAAERLASVGAKIADTVAEALQSGVTFSMLADDGAALNVFTDVVLHSAAGDGDRRPRAGNVGNRQAELSPAAGEPAGDLLDALHSAESVEELVQLIGVIKLLTLPSFGADEVESHQRVRFSDREVDVHERIAVAEVGLRLVAVVEADRNLRA